MKRVLALLDSSPVAASVAATAATIARANSLELDLVTISEPDDAPATEGNAEQAIPASEEAASAGRRRVVPGPVQSAIASELADESVVIVVLGARSSDGKPDGLGHIARTIATQSALPLVLVPPFATPLVSDDLSFLLPLDGSTNTTEAVIPIVADLVSAMGTVVPFHVFDAGTMPMLLSSDEDRAVIADEFAARHVSRVADRSAPTLLGLGTPADEILAAVSRGGIDAVVLGWHQRLESGHAEVVRRLLSDGRVVVVLEPVAPS